MMIAKLITLLIPFLAPSTAVQADAMVLAAAPLAASDSQVELYDLRALGLMRSKDPRIVLAPATLPYDVGNRRERYEILDIDQIMMMIDRICGDEFEFEGRAMWSNGDDALAVRAPGAVQAQVAKLLQLLSDSLGARIPVRVDIINHPSQVHIAPELLGIVGDAEVDRLRSSARAPGVSMQTYTIDVAPGELSTLDLTRLHPFVASYDVEIASSAFAFDPVIYDMISGTRLAMTCSPIEGGLGMTIFLRSGDPTAPPQRIDLLQKGFVSNESSRGYLEGPRYLQSMSIASRSYAFSSILPRGKALAFQSTLSLDTFEGTQVVIITPQGDPVPALFEVATAGSQADLFVVNTDAWAPARLLFSGEALRYLPDDLRSDRMHWKEAPLLVAYCEDGDRDHGWEYLESQCPDLVFEEAANWLIATRDPQATQELEDAGLAPTGLDQAVQTMMHRPESVQLRISLTHSGDVLSKGLSIELPLRIGHTAAVSMGVEGTQIADFDLEIAKGSSVGDPITSVYLDGLILVIEPRLAPDGSLRLKLQGLAQLMNNRDFFEPDSPMYRGIDQLLFDRFAIDQTVTLKDGKGNVSLGDASENAPSGSLRLDLELR